jgi:hypothetical protein
MNNNHQMVLGLRVVKLKDGRELTVRFLTGKTQRFSELFASMSDEALKRGMPPYTKDIIERWIGNIPNLIPLVAKSTIDQSATRQSTSIHTLDEEA